MPGQFLDNEEIISAIQSNDLVIEIWDGTVTSLQPSSPHVLASLNSDSSIQPSSIDLTMGKMYVPPEERWPDNDLPNTTPFKTGHKLLPGETVIIDTRETITLSSRLGAFGFPPASLAQNSILMTNPGHVDPGYSGHLRFTIINMRRDPFELKFGAKLVTLLIFQFKDKVQKDFTSLHGKTTADNTSTVLNSLAPDFADFEKRATRAAKKSVEDHTGEFQRQITDARSQQDRAERSFGWKTLAVPLFSGVVVALLTLATNFLGFATEESLEELQEKVDGLASSKVETPRVDNIVDQLSELKRGLVPLDRIESIDERIEKLEGEDLLRSISERLQALEETLGNSEGNE